MGIAPNLVDVFDGAALSRLLSEIHPEIIIQQLTDLPYALEAGAMTAALVRNARLRTESMRQRSTSYRAPSKGSHRASAARMAPTCAKDAFPATTPKLLVGDRQLPGIIDEAATWTRNRALTRRCSNGMDAEPKTMLSMQ